ncbi:MAG: DUF2971 domain-containing protein [Bacilli bacterium]|nr:DUF2971 domain-containing protein [Bacilli bacterium]
MIYNQYLKTDISKANEFINQICNIKSDNDLVKFYQTYLLFIINLDLDKYQEVKENCQECLLIADSFSSEIKSIFAKELLFVKYYNVILNYYDMSNIDLDELNVELQILRQELKSHEHEKTFLNEILMRINLFIFAMLSEINHDILKEIGISKLNFNRFRYVCDNITTRIFKHNENRRDISHYTSISNSFNILETSTLWVSRFDFLNDKYELRHITDIVESILCDLDKKQIDELSHEDQTLLYDFISIVNKVVKNLLDESDLANLTVEEKNLIMTSSCNYFVLSFCRKSDSLSMWGNYTKFNGCNLNFNGNKFISYYENAHIKSSLNLLIKQSRKNDFDKELFSAFYYGDVVYDKDKIKKALVDDYITTFRLFKTNNSGINKFIITRILLELTLIWGLFSKTQYFEYEEEYRLVFSLYDDLYKQKVRFRAAANNYIPYIEIPLDVNSLQKIVVGPLNNSDLAVKGFKEYVKHNNIDIIDISKSAIPFR